MLSNPFKLVKLKIQACDEDNLSTVIDEFTVLFNPTSYSRSYKIAYNCDKALNQTNSTVRNAQQIPESLRLKLILDGTHVDKTPAERLLKPPKTVNEQLKKFLAVAYKVNKEEHQPNCLKLSWGSEQEGGLNFIGRLKSVNVEYSLIDRDGSPLRAVLDTEFASSKPRAMIARENKLASADVTHIRTVQGEENLPLKTYQVYKDPTYYLEVARTNKLTNFRKLKVGQTLRFPPIQQ